MRHVLKQKIWNYVYLFNWKVIIWIMAWFSNQYLNTNKFNFAMFVFNWLINRNPISGTWDILFKVINGAVCKYPNVHTTYNPKLTHIYANIPTSKCKWWIKIMQNMSIYQITSYLCRRCVSFTLIIILSPPLISTISG